jgi:hypothetical protein
MSDEKELTGLKTNVNNNNQSGHGKKKTNLVNDVALNTR